MLNELPRLWKIHAYVQYLKHPMISSKYPFVVNKMNQIVSLLFSFLNVPSHSAIILREELYLDMLHDVISPILCQPEDGEGDRLHLFEQSTVGIYLQRWIKLLEIFNDFQNNQKYISLAAIQNSFGLWKQAFLDFCQIENSFITQQNIQKVRDSYFKQNF